MLVCSLLVLWLDDVDDIDAILGPLLLLAILCALAWFGYRRWRLRVGASRWTLTEAMIQSEYACNPASPGMAMAVGGAVGRVIASNTWKAVLQYTYQVADESYPGYLMIENIYNSREDASAAAQPFLLHRISVRYNPKRPWESSFLHADGLPVGIRSLGDQPPASGDVISLSLK
jgi:hypothetical protein